MKKPNEFSIDIEVNERFYKVYFNAENKKEIKIDQRPTFQDDDGNYVHHKRYSETLSAGEWQHLEKEIMKYLENEWF